MNYTQEISQKYIANDKAGIAALRDELIMRREQLNRWFQYFLDEFSEKMDNGLDSSDPIMKLYRDKYEQYTSINSAIRISESYLVHK